MNQTIAVVIPTTVTNNGRPKVYRHKVLITSHKDIMTTVNINDIGYTSLFTVNALTNYESFFLPVPKHFHYLKLIFYFK